MMYLFNRKGLTLFLLLTFTLLSLNATESVERGEETTNQGGEPFLKCFHPYNDLPDVLKENIASFLSNNHKTFLAFRATSQQSFRITNEVLKPHIAEFIFPCVDKLNRKCKFVSTFTQQQKEDAARIWFCNESHNPHRSEGYIISNKSPAFDVIDNCLVSQNFWKFPLGQEFAMKKKQDCYSSIECTVFAKLSKKYRWFVEFICNYSVYIFQNEFELLNNSKPTKRLLKFLRNHKSTLEAEIYNISNASEKVFFI